jgi:hypothetical protein
MLAVAVVALVRPAQQEVAALAVVAQEALEQQMRHLAQPTQAAAEVAQETIMAGVKTQTAAQAVPAS